MVTFVEAGTQGHSFPHSIYEAEAVPQNGHITEEFRKYMDQFLEDRSHIFQQLYMNPEAWVQLRSCYHDVVYRLVAWLRDRPLMRESNYEDAHLQFYILDEIRELREAFRHFENSAVADELPAWKQHKEHPVTEVADIVIFIFQHFALQGKEIVSHMISADESRYRREDGRLHSRDGLLNELEITVNELPTADVEHVGALIAGLFNHAGVTDTTKMLRVIQGKMEFNARRYQAERLREMNTEQFIWLWQYFQETGLEASGMALTLLRALPVQARREALKILRSDEAVRGLDTDDESAFRELLEQRHIQALLQQISEDTQFFVAMKALRHQVKRDSVAEKFYSENTPLHPLE